MGYPIAGHLRNAGHSVCVYNRTAARADQWVAEFGGAAAPTPREAAQHAEFVFSCVGRDDDLRAVVLGSDGAFSGMGEGTVFVDHTTTSATVARELAGVGSERAIRFVDAPVSGGEIGAQNGVLTVMCGGAQAAFERVRPVIGAYARVCALMGPVGAGQLAKMVNQTCAAGLLQGLAEGLNFGMRAGLDMDKLIDVISKGAAQSWQMDNRARSMCRGEFDFGFAVDWMRKDLGIVLEEAKRNGARLPITEIVDGYYAQLQARGGNRWDTSSLIELVRDG